MADPNFEQAKAELATALDARLANFKVDLVGATHDDVVGILRADEFRLNAVGTTLLFKGGQAPDGRPEGVTLEQCVWWTDYRTKIIEGKIDAVAAAVSALAAQAGGAAADAAAKLDQILADLSKGPSPTAAE